MSRAAEQADRRGEVVDDRVEGNVSMLRDSLARILGVTARAYQHGRRRQGGTDARLSSVMPGFMPGLHVLARACRQDVDGRDKSGHDDLEAVPDSSDRGVWVLAGACSPLKGEGTTGMVCTDSHPSCPALCRASTS